MVGIWEQEDLMAKECPVCHGTGIVYDDSIEAHNSHTCWWCKGLGEIAG